MKILIGADLVPTPSNEQMFIDGNMETVVGKDMKEILDSADFRIFNLELALTDEDSPIRKAGPNLRAPVACINGYKALGVDLLGISNNHVVDHGFQGFDSTIKTLDAVGIAHVGGGYSQKEAAAPYIFEKEGKKIGVYACCEHEFSWVSDYGFGSNGFDALESLDEIVELKSKVDYVIVLYHGGKEHYRYPSPYLRKVCRKIVEKGADLVLCQHTHAVGTEEDYKGGKIIFGQGNFVFAKQLVGFDTWDTGILVSLDLTDEGATFDYIPYERTETGLKISNDSEILDGFYARSEEIKQEGFIETKFEEMAESIIEWRYIQNIMGFGVDKTYVEKRGTALLGYAECEVHRECLLTGIRKRLGLGKYEQ